MVEIIVKSFVPYCNEAGWIPTTEEVRHVQKGHGGKFEDCPICLQDKNAVRK